jgi:hypothetical protein
MDISNPLVGFQGHIKLSNAHPDIIKAVQRQLIKLNLLFEKETGEATKSTMLALATFKKLEYLEQPEMLGSSTAKALLSATEKHDIPHDTEKVIVGLKTVRIIDVGVVASDQKIYPGSNFNWGEFTKGLTRIPDNGTVVRNLVKLAHHLDGVRAFLGNRPITLTSVYRPPAINKACGGVVNSRHLFGDAADIIVQGIPPHDVFRKLNDWHSHRGGLGDGKGFTHIDLRGYKARFTYG